MSNGTAGLRHKIDSAGDLQSVVRTMKALAASNIGQYEQSVRALADYYRTLELGLGVCLREARRANRADQQLDQQPDRPEPAVGRTAAPRINAIVFGSDQGLVGQFNDAIADHAISTLADLPGQPDQKRVWAVGERVQARLLDAGLTLQGLFNLPNSVKGVAPLIGRVQIQIEAEAHLGSDPNASLYVFHTRTRAGAVYEPVTQRLLPLDAQWQRALTEARWPGKNLPQVLGENSLTLRALIHEYLYIALFRACAESLASENASRLSAMERADKNIDELLENLHRTFHRLRQSAIDEELFDVVAGYESLAKRARA